MFRGRVIPAFFNCITMDKRKNINERNTISFGIKGIGVQKIIDNCNTEYLRRAYREELKNIMNGKERS